MVAVLFQAIRIWKNPELHVGKLLCWGYPDMHGIETFVMTDDYIHVHYMLRPLTPHLRMLLLKKICWETLQLSLS